MTPEFKLNLWSPERNSLMLAVQETVFTQDDGRADGPSSTDQVGALWEVLLRRIWTWGNCAANQERNLGAGSDEPIHSS